MLYQISNGAVAFGDDVILHSIDFEIRNTEKIAIVGRNGCGKTTLLKLISGEVEMEKLDSDTLSAQQIMDRLGLKNRASFRKLYLVPALEHDLIEMEYPDKPNSSKQRYRNKK